ncbi:unnamed protein product [Gulo gulo]|uniref:Uncharacterized protein n=1 Tax=Gulo gulo TaxID=48420 RepID=A0A9X9PXV7_GULGU|nr:unnamed protein product [Gulo gulo]
MRYMKGIKDKSASFGEVEEHSILPPISGMY